MVWFADECRAPVLVGRMTDGWGALFGTLIPLALVVALSPLSILPAVLLVLHVARPRPTGLAFLLGWVVGLAVVAMVFVQVPHLLGGLHRSSPSWTAWVRIGFGIVLILAGGWRWVTRKGASQNPPKWLTTMSKISPAGAVAIGFVLVLINPKFLLATGAAGLSIGTAELDTTTTTVAIVFYVALAASTVAAPIVAYAVAAERIDPQLERGRLWIDRHQAGITAAILLVIGLVLLAMGVRAR